MDCTTNACFCSSLRVLKNWIGSKSSVGIGILDLFRIVRLIMAREDGGEQSGYMQSQSHVCIYDLI